MIADVLERAIVAGEASVKRGPELLPVLRDAGVVDAGGYGVTIIFAGVVAALRGERGARARAPPPPARGHPPRARSPRPTATARTSPSPASGLERRAPSSRRSRRIGDSVLVVGDAHDAEGPRPHRRARAARPRSSPARARSRASTSPTCTSRSPSATERLRRRRRHGRRALRRAGGRDAATACAALFAGLGARRRSTAARRSTPRPTSCSPASTRCPPRRSSCCPNSPNVIMAAERAAELSEKVVRVVADALAAGRPGRRGRADARPPAAENAAAMQRRARARAHRRRRAGRARGRRRAASRSATRSASSRRSSSPGASPRRTLRDGPRRAWRATPSWSPASPATARRSATRQRARARARRRRARARDGGQPSWLVAARRPSERPALRRARRPTAPGGHDLTPCRRPSPAATTPEREALLAAPVRWPRPVALEAPLAVTPGQGRGGRARRSGLQTVGDLLVHLPRDRREARTVAELAPGEQATVVVEVRSIALAPVRRRGMKPLVEATVADETGRDEGRRSSTSRGSSASTRPARGSCCTASTRPATASASLARAHGARRRRGGGERRPLPGDRGHHVDADPRAGARRTATPSATSPSRCPGRLRVAERPARPPRGAGRGALRRPRGRPPAPGLRRAAARPARPAAPPRAPPRDARRAALDGGADADARAGWTSCCRSRRPATSARAMAAVDADLAGGRPMQRLLMGEVGSGKTVVALLRDAARRRARQAGRADGADRDAGRAALRDAAGAAARRGGARRAADRLHAGGAGAPTSWASSRRGELSLVVGTHALIEDAVVFDRLAVAVVDEQHRFGVRQRTRAGREGAGRASSRTSCT